ncbi:SAV_2336 N-terminal domain-related protein [Streptomyces inhibens]|uniref:SAV_2336 N-terminal domain-related protein n=1 Tax=Streptomyces inhibens TaxID=2293571 RepID=UPI00367F66CF
MIEPLRQAMSAAGYDLGATELLDVLWLARAMEGRGAPGEPGGTGEPGETADPGECAAEAGDGAGPAGAEETEVESGGPARPDGAPAGSADASAPAGRSGGTDAARHTGPAGPTEPDDPSDRTEHADPADPSDPQDSTRLTDHPEPAAPAGPPRRALYAMGSQGGEAGADRVRPARVPGGRALPDAQQLGRALRPLRRSRDHPQRTVTDIEATVRIAAETGFLDVVSRPDQERRWSAVLLVDCSPSMQVWGPLAAELRALLTRSTVFRSVQVHTIDPQDPSGPARRRPAAGAAVIFLLTDGTSPGWRAPQAVRALSAWGRSGPIAVLNPLPRRLWRGTALDARPRLLTAPGEFDAVGRLLVCDALSGEADPEADGVLALPVLHPTASALEQWAGLLTRPGVPHLIETALLDEAPPPVLPRQPHGTAEELLTHFRGAFSPESYRLAVRLSAIRPLTTPLMQLVRAATMRDAGPTHVAEILLGGLLERTDRERDAAAALTLDRALGAPPPGQPVQPVYDFRPGVRELLFSGLGAEQAVEVVEAVGRSLEPYMGRLPDFPVLMGDEEGELRLHASARAFAVLASPVLERMGGVVPERLDGVVPGQRTGSPDGAGPRSVPASPPQPVRFAVLGSVRAWRGRTPVRLGSPKEQALLAALLLRPGRSATAPELVADIWGDEPPRSALATLHTYVSRLRTALGADVLTGEQGGGYTLRRPGADAHDPALGPDPDPDLDLDLDLDLDEADRLIARARARHTQDPAEARQLRDAALALWEGAPLAGLPGPFAEAHRARLERWRNDLMAEVYRPLAQDREPEPAPVALPRALPPAPEHFFGRTKEISRLVEALTRTDGDSPPCWAVHGPAGVGKTALALRVVHEAAEHFPDGQLFVDLRDSGPDRLALCRTLLAERRVLLVLDDAPDAAETLASVLPGPTGTPAARGGAVLITGRRRPQHRALTGALALDRLTAAEAHHALPRRALLQWLDAQLTPPARRAFRLLAVPEADRSSAVISLGAASALLDTTADRTRSSLDELQAAGVLRRTAPDRCHYAGELRALARETAVQELSEAQHDEALSRLLDFSLALGRQVHERRYPGERWRNDLTRVASSALPRTGLPKMKDGTSALAVWADETPQLLALVRQIAVRSPRHVRRAADLLLLAQVTADSGVLSAAYEPAARAVAERAATVDDDRAEGRARAALAEAYITMGKFTEAEPEARRADRLAGRSGDPLTGFRAPYARAVIALHQGRHDEAERHLTAVWERCRTRNDQLGEAAVLGALARVWAATGSSNDAVLFAERSVGIHRRTGGDSPRLAHGLYALSEALSSAGRHADALRELFQALPLFEEDRQHLWAGRTRCRMAEAMVALIRPSEAAAAAEDAAKRLLVPGGERWRADALVALGHAETALGRKQGARAHWREALAVYEAFDAPEARGVRALLRDRTGPSSAGSRGPGVSRTADTASTGTVLRDLTAAVRTLRDRLRLQPAVGQPDLRTAAPGADPAAGPAAPRGTLEALEILAAVEAELAGRVAEFARTGRPPRADLTRLRSSLETVTSHEALTESTSGAADAAVTVRDLSRRLTR